MYLDIGDEKSKNSDSKEEATREQTYAFLLIFITIENNYFMFKITIMCQFIISHK